MDVHRAFLRARGVNVATRRLAAVSKEGAAAEAVSQKDGIVTLKNDFSTKKRAVSGAKIVPF